MNRQSRTLAIFLPAEAMADFLASLIGPPTSYAAGQRLFDRLVQRGMLRPWIEDLWELETRDPADWKDFLEGLARE